MPTLAETGVSGIDASVWWGIWAPAGIPKSVAEKLEKDIAQVISSQDVIEQFKGKKFETMNMSSVEFKEFVRKETETVKSIVKKAGIEPQ